MVKNLSIIPIIFLFVLCSATLTNALTTDKQEYEINEQIIIKLAPDEISSQNKLVINNGAKYYQYNNKLTEEITFKAPEAGTYQISIRTPEKEISKSILVKERQIKEPEESSIITTDKPAYFIGEKVIIFVSRNYGTINIYGPENEYQVAGEINNPLEFKPLIPGNYKIAYYDNQLIDETEFLVINKEFIQEKGTIRLKDFSNKPIRHKVIAEELSSDQGLTQPREYAIKIIPELRAVDEIQTITNLDYPEILLEEIYPLHQNNQLLNAFRVESEKTIKIINTAKGSRLLKCTNYTSTCNSGWNFERELTPGIEYEIIVDSNVAYAEIGLSAINSIKPIYRPGELAEFIAAVVDSQGYLVSNLHSELEIKNNLQSNKYLMSEKQKGVYEGFGIPFLGNNNITLTSSKENFYSEQTSNLLVQENYDFDIIRNMPVTIDPFKEDLFVNITIVPFVDREFVFTEILPPDYSNINGDYDEKIIQENSILLVWKNLSGNNNISYNLELPKISPALRIHESLISTNESTFEEARPWMLVLDPNSDFRPTSFTDASNIGTNEANAYDNDASSSSSVAISANANPAYVVYSSFDTSSFAQSSTVNAINVTFTVQVSGTSNDRWALQYSTNSGSSWNDCRSLATGNVAKQDFTCAVSVTGWTLSDIASSFQVRVGGDRESSSDGASLLLYETYVSVDYTPPNVPPYYITVDKNATSINQNDFVYFNSTWTDPDSSSLDVFVFSTNQSGTWVNSSQFSFVGNLANYTTQITASPNSLVGWRFFARDTEGAWNSTPIQSFTVADANDENPPSITNPQVSPTTGISGTNFSFSATITDDSAINLANVEIYYPDGQIINYSMSNSGSSYSYLFTGSAGGNYSARIIAVDSNGNRNTSSILEFNVTSTSSINKIYYTRGETVYFDVDGFSPNANITLDIKDDRGISISGYPLVVVATSTGTLNYEWNISTNPAFRLGVYNITATDNNFGWLSESASPTVILKPNTATRYDDNGGGVDVLFETNESDNTDARIRSSQNEDYIEFTFNNTVATGYDINDIFFYVEHQEVATYNMEIQVLDAGVWTTACTFTSSIGSERIDSCNLSTYITSNAEAQNVGMRISDGGGIPNNVEWSDIDFAYLYINFSLSSTTTVTITEPVDTANNYNFSDSTNNKAYDGGNTALPPATLVTGTEASSTEYSNLVSDDENRMTTLITGNTGQRAYQSFNFKITQAVSDLSNIRFDYQGYATARTDLQADPFYIYIWNNNTGAYDLQSTGAAATDDVDESFVISTGLSDYIDANGNIWILVEGDHATGGGLNAQANLNTDKATLIVNEFPVLTGLQNITAEALDLDGISICSYRYRGQTGYNGMASIGGDLYRNESDTSVVPDGFYYIDVLCNDTGVGFGNDSIYVRIDNSAPTVLLVSPPNYSNFTTSIINFTWNGTDNGGGQLTCDLFINGAENTSNILSNNGANTIQEISGLTTGIYNWSVACSDSGGATNNSETWIFRVDLDPPTIILNSPANNYYANISNINFDYTPTDFFSINQCQLFINQLLNSTNNSIINGGSNYFNNIGVSEGYYNWTVGCTDEFGNVQNSTPYSFTVDQTPPTVYLNVTSGYVFSNPSVTLNYTAIDNLDSSLSCNLTISDGTNDNNIASSNNTLITRSFTLGDGTKFWNVTCVDNAGLAFTSETRNFTVSGPPTVTIISPPNNEFVSGITQTFVYYAEDGDGITNCSLYFDGSFNQSNSTPINNGGNNNFTLTNIAQGLHTWQVQCYDTAPSLGNTTTYNIYVDRTPPNIQLFYPSEGALLPDENVNLNFTATDNLDTSLICDLYIDGVISTTNNNFAVTSGSVHNLSETIFDGNHNWSVTCSDGSSSILNTNTSLTNNFSVSGPPAVSLISPQNNTSSIENVTFVYFAGDSSGLANCSIFIDGILNQTNSGSLANYSNNNFTINNIGQGYHDWNVQCFDNGNKNTTTGNYSIYIDTQAPIVTSKFPDGQTYNTDTVEFNWSVSDDYSTSFSCSVFIDGSIAESGISVTSGNDYLHNISGISDGFHEWNITCNDDAGINGTSSTKNFTIDAAPTVYLFSPLNNNGSRTGNVTFTYEVYESNLANCSLIINGEINQTNTSAQIPNVNNGLLNNFTINNMAQGLYNWSVTCYDTNGFAGLAEDDLGDVEVRDLWIDFGFPWVELNYPDEGQNISFATIDFNFTAYDEISEVLSCDLYLNDVLNTSGILANNNQSTIASVHGFSAGDYNWSVTCRDYSAYTNNTETRNFTINPLPSVELFSPQNASTQNTSTFNLFYVASDLEGISFCDLYWDGVYNNTKVAAGGGVVNGGISNFSITDTTQGLHTWQINCTDTDSNFALSETWEVYIDLTNPWITLNYPVSVQVNSSTVEFNYTAYDNLDSELLCNFQADNGNYTNNNIASTNATPVLFSFSGFNDGSHTWNVSCVDNGLNYNISTTATFTVQEKPLITLIAPANNNRTNIVNQNFTYLPTDNSNQISSCELIINGALNQTNISIVNGVSNNFTINNMNHGIYSWQVNCSDPSSNENSSEQRTLTIDLLGPNIELILPTEGQILNQEDINFTWNATDSYSGNVFCDFYLDGVLNGSSIPGISGSLSNYSVFGISDGPHNWSVTCVDDLGNSNSSVLGNFTINSPDFVTNNGNITFNNTNPDLNENITIEFTVFNLGGVSDNAYVEIWNGPIGSGTFIGNDTQLIGINESVQFNISWIINAGYHNINAYVDPYNNRFELNETNNNASINISVLSAQINSPASETLFSNSPQNINFSVQDYTLGTINYTLFVNGIAQVLGTTTDNQSVIESIALSEGLNTVTVEALDYISRRKNSTTFNYYLDTTAPVVIFNDTNFTWFNESNINILFNITDNLDTNINYTIYINGIFNESSNSSSSSVVSKSLSLLDGIYNFTVEAYDDVLNTRNYTLLFYVDTTDPVVNLTTPLDNHIFNTRDVLLNYTVSDNLGDPLVCSLYVDASLQDTSNVFSGTNKSVAVNGLAENSYTWYASCYDNATNTATTPTRNFFVYIAPTISLVSPQNNYITNNDTIIFSFNATDETGLFNCSLLIDGQINDTKTSSELNNGGISNFTVSGLSGTRDWGVQCYDSTSQRMYSITDNRTITVDKTPPVPTILTQNSTWFNTQPTINFNITDDISTIINYTIYVDGVANTFGTVANNTNSNAVLSSVSNGTHEIIVEGLDQAGNYANSTPITIYVDTVLPNVILSFPTQAQNITSNSVNFNFTVTDNLANNITFYLFVDNLLVNTSSVLNNTLVNQTFSFSAGSHNWYVNVTDIAGNTYMSEVRNFTIVPPDLVINTGNITFNTTTATENTNVTISATIFNIGNTDAGTFSVQFYYKDPDTGGIQIDNDKVIASLATGANTTLNVSYVLPIGSNDIYVLVDTPLSTNGSIAESNEDNNKAFNSLSVGLWHFISGDTSDNLVVDDNLEISVYDWLVSNSTGSNIFAADIEAVISFQNLTALSRDLSNTYQAEDFYELDTAMGSENLTDSVNNSFTANNNPILTKQFTILGKTVSNVPVTNSTNNSNFVTGILWDASDGNTEYNGSQDAVFVTEINKQRQGRDGIVDFEMRIPALLRELDNTESTTAYLYTEIK